MHPRPCQASPYLLNITWALSLACFSARHQKRPFLQMWNLLERKEKSHHRRKKRRSHQRSRKNPSHHVEATRENLDPRALHLGRDHAQGRSGGGVCLRWLTYLEIISAFEKHDHTSHTPYGSVLYMTSIHQIAPRTLPPFIHSPLISTRESASSLHTARLCLIVSSSIHPLLIIYHCSCTKNLNIEKILLFGKVKH